MHSAYNRAWHRVITIIVVIITAPPLGWQRFCTLTSIPGSWLRWGLPLLFCGTQEQVRGPFDSWLGFWVYNVRMSHGPAHNSLYHTCLEKVGFNQWISRFSTPACALGKSLAKTSSQWLSDFIWKRPQWGASGRMSVSGGWGEPASSAVMFSQAVFFQGSHPCRFPACAFKSKQWECPFAKETEKPFRKLPLGRNCWAARSLAGVIQWIYSLMCCNRNVHPDRKGFSWVLEAHFGDILCFSFVLPVCLHVCLPCSFSPLGFCLEKLPPPLFPPSLGFRFTHTAPGSLSWAPYTCLSRDAPHSRHHGLFSHLSLLLEGDLHPFRDCVVCSQWSLRGQARDQVKQRAPVKEWKQWINTWMNKESRIQGYFCWSHF